MREAVLDPSWIPPRKALAQVLDFVADPELGVHAVRAVVRAGAAGAAAAAARWSDAPSELRPGLLDVIGRVAGHDGEPAHVPLLLASLRDPDGKVRRAAMRALGRLGGVAHGGQLPKEIEAGLLEAWSTAADLPEQRAVMRALSTSGSQHALSTMRSVQTSDPELRRLIDEGITKLERTVDRADAAPLRPVPLPAPVFVRVWARNGLESLLCNELEELGVEIDTSVPERVGSVAARAKDFAPLLRSRIALRLGILPPKGGPQAGRQAELEEQVAAALAPLLPLMRAWTVDRPIRYRIEWVGRGHQRSLTYRVARAIDTRWADLRNDPRDSPWEFRLVTPSGPGEERLVELELHPRGLPDDRFAYRVALLPAATHPTVAAALVRAAGVDAHDVVWDPFVGSGIELIERARLGPVRRLYGSDRDPQALEAARANLAAASVPAVLALAELGTGRPPERPTLVLTNPPMGRRVLDRASLTPLYERFFTYVPTVMADHARIAWYTPAPELCIELARAAGFEPMVRRTVDMSGMMVEQQVLVRQTTLRGKPRVTPHSKRVRSR